MLQRIKDYLIPPAIADLPALHRFASGEASYVAQRSTYEFSRNTLAWFGQSAFGDAAFNRHFAASRWEAYAAILADMVLAVRSHVQHAASDAGISAACDGALLRLYAAMLADYPNPAHRPDGWGDAIERVRARLAAPAPAKPPDARRTARASARRIVDSLPVRSADDAQDMMVITNAVAFGLIAFADRLAARADPARLAAVLAAEP